MVCTRQKNAHRLLLIGPSPSAETPSPRSSHLTEQSEIQTQEIAIHSEFLNVPRNGYPQEECMKFMTISDGLPDLR